VRAIATSRKNESIFVIDTYAANTMTFAIPYLGIIMLNIRAFETNTIMESTVVEVFHISSNCAIGYPHT
jgi:hypothetical protein